MNKTHPKLIVSIIIAVLVIIFMFQNSETVQIHLFFWTISMSRAIMVFSLLIAGILIGWFLN
ncbi:MAG: LapA family protein, partial [Melioribacteraceae bacterium]|nr:LapA family protein [Melioribacteraceae bacterium]